MTGSQATPPSPQQAAAQLGIIRYSLTAVDQRVHDRLSAMAPWANWAEMVPKTRSMPGVTWLVTVFAVDNDRFLTLVSADEAAGELTILGAPESNGRGH